MYNIRNFQKGDEDKLRRIFVEMKRYYPHIEEWSIKSLKRIKSKKSFCKVATLGDKIIGFAITTEKEEGVIKLNSFYVSRPYQKKFAIGQDLLQDVLQEISNRSARYIFVTMGADLFDALVPFFRRYGFQIEGIAPNRYRKGKFEIIMGKNLYYGQVSEENFYEFIKRELFVNRGYKILKEGNGDLIISPRYDILGFQNTRNLNRTVIRISTQSNPNTDDVAKFNEEYLDRPLNKIFISFYGFKKKPYDRKEEIIILDAYDIETIFYPVELSFSQNKQKDFIVPLSLHWVKRNFPLFAPNNEYYTPPLIPSPFLNRAKKIIPRGGDISMKGFRRGSHLILYDRDRDKIFGTAKLMGFQVGKPKTLYDHYRNKSNVSLDGFKEIAGLKPFGEEKNVMIIEIEWYRELENKISLEDLPGIDRERIKDDLKDALYSIPHEKYREISFKGQTMNKVVMSIKPGYAKKIFTREKKYELRRQKTKIIEGTMVCVYATAPIKCLIGHFTAGRVIEGTLSQLWDFHHRHLGISYKEYNSYFKGKKRGFAIEILEPVLWKNKISLEQIRHHIKFYNPPQSHAYLSRDHVLMTLIQKMPHGYGRSIGKCRR